MAYEHTGKMDSFRKGGYYARNVEVGAIRVGVI